MTASHIDSIVQLAQSLVRIPSRSGIDSYDGVLVAIADWLEDAGVRHVTLRDEAGRAVGVCGDVADVGSTGYVLSAPIDTAAFGDVEAWTHKPTSGDIQNGWLYGRGSADCKIAVAIFCHIAAKLSLNSEGGMRFLFDADEHTGTFTGIQAYLDAYAERISGVMIGYPGNDRVVVGSRGFWRAELRVHGVSAHSGGSSQRGSNAVSKAARLIRELERLELSAARDPPQTPCLTVTGIGGGGDYSQVPDLCTVAIDVRLTPEFTAEQTERTIRNVLERFDGDYPAHEQTSLRIHGGWPPYRLPPDSRLARALQQAAYGVWGRRPPLETVGPSNIGNYLASRGIEATCGFGVTYRNIHGVDECVELASVGAVYQTYLSAVRILNDSTFQ